MVDAVCRSRGLSFVLFALFCFGVVGTCIYLGSGKCIFQIVVTLLTSYVAGVVEMLLQYFRDFIFYPSLILIFNF